MDTFVPDRVEQQRQGVEALLAGHPMIRGIVGYHVTFEDTWDGEPAVGVYLHQVNDGPSDERYIAQMKVLYSLIVDELRAIAPDREGHVTFIKPPGIKPPGPAA